MKIIKNLCKVINCTSKKILYNGFDNTITDFDIDLQMSFEDKSGKYHHEFFTEAYLDYNINDIRLIANNKLKHVIISLTENCNLRCEYCGYQDTRYECDYSLQDMNEIKIEKVIDFIVKHSVEANETVISFYGGEPLLKYELIKYAIKYLEEKNIKGHKYRYHITTNGTLLNKDIIEFFITKDIFCVISLDGPVFIHDRYRIYDNGNPTYIDIIKNIYGIINKYPLYYKNNIEFQSVISPPYNRIIPFDFFSNIKKRFINVSVSNYFDKHLKNVQGIEFQSYESEKKSEDVYPKLDAMNNDELTKNLDYITTLKKYTYIGEKNIRSSIFPSGFCSPLPRRIFVMTSGELTVCDRVDENNPFFVLGDIHTGYDFEKFDILYKYTNSILSENCIKCWAFRFCSTCFASMNKIDYDGDYCKAIRHDIEQDLVCFLDLKFNNKRFNEIMQTISID